MFVKLNAILMLLEIQWIITFKTYLGTLRDNGRSMISKTMEIPSDHRRYEKTREKIFLVRVF